MVVDSTSAVSVSIVGMRGGDTVIAGVVIKHYCHVNLTKHDDTLSDLTREVLRCGYNGYGVSGSILKTSQCEASSGATINSHTAISTSTISIENDVTINTTGWRNPRHSDVSETFLFCHHISGS